jgi:hypothetical protein
VNVLVAGDKAETATEFDPKFELRPPFFSDFIPIDLRQSDSRK